jgi:hypothetical protein|tara:strand:- start:1653 stop:1862 length:210 start_codon:yes stop_codon:yes gene_type:complete
MNKVDKYELIDWNIPNNKYKINKVVYMTTDQAREINKTLVEAKTSQRYIRGNFNGVSGFHPYRKGRDIL